MIFSTILIFQMSYINKYNKKRMVHALALKYLRLLKPYTPQDIRNVIFNTFLESTSDGVIEFYEFIDLLRLVELHPNIIHMGDLKQQIQTMQSSGVIRDPQGF